MEKHLEFIQGVINRHNSNSFMLKGWAITIASALYALAGTVNEPIIILITLAPIILFWGLDAFYLSNERCFVDLYNAVANKGIYILPNRKMFKKDFNENATDNVNGTIAAFNMNFKKFKIWKDNSWINVLKSKTILGLYLSLTAITLVIWVVLFLVKMEGSKDINVNATLKSDKFEMKINNPPPTIINNIYPTTNKVDSSKSRTNKN